MSDGPHRSLPLKPHWRAVAERAAKDAWSAEDVAEALSRAAAIDFREVPVGALRRILDAGPIASLFSTDPHVTIAEIDGARAGCRGSAIANAAIDGAIQAVQRGETGQAAYTRAVEYALHRDVSNHSRSIEEHYQREAGDRSARHMRDRLAEARSRCDFAEKARLYAQTEIKMPRATALERKTGLDDGPAIPQ
ncbi:MAG: hypothetical protein VX874_17640 [Pseudomonadota bacterium]|nr:hypothetical protein [Pseudomonadota bacterium]